MADNTSALLELEDFKEIIHTKVHAYCRKKYAINTNSLYITPLMEDMLENLEAHIETLAEQTIHDEDIRYETYQGE
jgi:hypothetical protein